ncbi:hypothetical protein [Aquirufa nivalisilvae]|uniref:hypothetical protein n=1 Tax=Aquirufa nivalisilvae TaxID=2516557 RepID=UPI0022A9BCDC|nr:hypothetical protein [Aquirufa nivalisilvae]MCZ2480006.1 hypothetical protein [Aquirufa nivalisilvae]
MSTQVITMGLSKIEIGEIAVDGGMGTSLSQLGLTYEGTCKLTTDEPEITEHYAEEVEDPIVINQKKGKTMFEFSIMDPNADTLEAVLGGTVAAGPPKVWNSPRTSVTIERSIKISPEEGMTFSIPRGLITAKMNAEFSRKNIFLIDVKVRVLTPNKAATSPIIATEQA